MTQMLLDHFKRMQGMATRYLADGEMYVRQSDRQQFLNEQELSGDESFANDMIYMLDGPEQREAQARAELVVSQGYPTEDAYMRTCRALHWRTEQLRQAGIEPLNLMEYAGAYEHQLPQYPPEHFRFPDQGFSKETRRYITTRAFAFGIAVGGLLSVIIVLLR